MTDTLSKRALNRALLARQFLLKRAKAAPLAVIEHLCGMQSQVPRPPFIGLWTRLETFDAASLNRLMLSKKAVRGTAMRGTIHTLSVKDFLHFRPLLAEMLMKGAMGVVGKRLGKVDVATFHTVGRDYFSRNAAPFDRMRDVLAAKFPKLDTRAVAYTIRMGLPLVMVPTDDDRWGYPANADFTLADSWLGRNVPMDVTGAALDALMLRYLAAFGPATPGDAQKWSGLRALRDVFERLRPRLVTFRDEKKRELFDIPTAPRPDADTPAPVRFLPEYDNVALAHDDRSRIIAREHHSKLVTKNLIVLGAFTVDGFIAGTWRVEAKSKKQALMTLSPFTSVPKKVAAEVKHEAEQLLDFLEPEVSARTLRFT